MAVAIAGEAAVFGYGLGSWRARPHEPGGAVAFSHHRRSGHTTIVVAFMLMLAVEGLAVHLLLLEWNALAAWIATIGTVYGAVWLMADLRATILRPILVTDDSIVFRAGLRFTLQVPLAQIAAIGREKPPFGKESVNLTLLGAPTHWLTLSEPLVGCGAYGLRRRVRAIGIAPDDGDAFDRILRERSV